jgi:RNA polymerase sigma factor (sigma-70 family)
MTPEKFGAAYEIGYPRTVRFLLSRAASRDEANEIAQQAWTRGWERIASLRKPDSILEWINSIAYNEFRSDCGKKRRFTDLSEINREPRTTLAINITEIDVRRKLMQRRPQQRGVVTALMAGCSHREVAEMLGITEGAVRSRAYHARLALYAELGAYSDCQNSERAA